MRKALSIATSSVIVVVVIR